MDGGFAVHEAEDGDQASVLIAQDPGAYTLLVTDIHMPGSLDGIEVARLVRTLRPELPVIYTTGRPDVLRHLQPFGPREVLLPKPFAFSDLLAAAQRLLNPPHLGPCSNSCRTTATPEAGYGNYFCNS